MKYLIIDSQLEGKTDDILEILGINHLFISNIEYETGCVVGIVDNGKMAISTGHIFNILVGKANINISQAHHLFKELGKRSRDRNQINKSLDQNLIQELKDCGALQIAPDGDRINSDFTFIDLFTAIETMVGGVADPLAFFKIGYINSYVMDTIEKMSNPGRLREGNQVKMFSNVEVPKGMPVHIINQKFEDHYGLKLIHTQGDTDYVKVSLLAALMIDQKYDHKFHDDMVQAMANDNNIAVADLIKSVFMSRAVGVSEVLAMVKTKTGMMKLIFNAMEDIIGVDLTEYNDLQLVGAILCDKANAFIADPLTEAAQMATEEAINRMSKSSPTVTFDN